MDEVVSVVIVCFNRQEDATEAIESLLNQTVKPLEIILIDDGSSPPLSLSVNGEHLKIVRLDHEVGLSNARNIGVKMASGKYVAFIDDDAIAERTWIEEVQRNVVDCDIFGGAIYPLYLARPPDWWNEKDFGEYVGVGNIWKSHGRNQIWGTNMVIKKEVFREIGYFNPLLGRQKGKLISCEEEDFVERARRVGLRVKFVSKVKVFHKVKQSRMTLSYLFRRSYYAGKSQKSMSGYQPARTLFDILRLVILMASPSTFISSKNDKIAKIIWIAWLLGHLY